LNPVEEYIRKLRDLRGSGAAGPETSYYPALSNLLDAVGAALKPKVRCIPHPADTGAGTPDFGLFTAEQFQKSAASEPLPGSLPARGVVEAKPVADSAWLTAEGEQVTKYWNRYGQVLVTNYRDFLLVGRDPEGRQVKLESYSLAKTPDEFWAQAAHPRKMAEEHGERLIEYLKRAMLHSAPLTDPKDVAWFMASYAREALRRVEAHPDVPALDAIRSALEEALGITFEDRRGGHFFRSTLVQTLFYGLFSAWVLWTREHPPAARERFDWRTAGYLLRVPVLAELFYQLSNPAALAGLKLPEVLDWTGATVNRIDRAGFFSSFREHHAVQYFYEPFLEAFDPELRKQLGVWYTPHEVVRYIVARVDQVLREELGVSGGLADPNVYILDPCCGTGSFLIETLDRIARSLSVGGDALAAQEVKRAATTRVFGFEILPAPFVVAHLQISLMLQSLGAPFSETKKERASVYLTNALTGWEPPEGIKQQMLLAFPELRHERDAAERVKQATPILVILGNPPYNGFAGVAVAEERDLSEAYRTTRRAPKPQGHGLNDLYVRFFRMAERRIVEKTGRGVVCFISNYSWLDGLSHTGMRERYLDQFDRIWIDCLNGDKYKTGKLTPEGEPDPSVFSTEFNREGIQIGTAIALLARRHGHADTGKIEFRDLWGKSKRSQLLADAVRLEEIKYQELEPPLGLGLPFRPATIASGYLSWPLLPELFPVSFPGVKTSRDEFVVDIDKDRLIERMKRYFDPEVSDADIKASIPAAMADAARFDARKTRRALLKIGFRSEQIVKYCYRPFDERWLYWEPTTKLLDEKRAEYFPHVFTKNPWLAAVQQNRKNFDPPAVTDSLASLHLIERGANLFPLFLRLKTGDQTQPNLSRNAFDYLGKLNGEEKKPEILFWHAVAVLCSLRYAKENATALRQGWPRIPLPSSKEILADSAQLGGEIARLLDLDDQIAGVASGEIRAELSLLAVISREHGGTLDPEAGDLDVTAGWGHRGVGGAVMPGKGRIAERDYSKEESAAIADGVQKAGLTFEQAIELLGNRTLDIYLNNTAYWKNIPPGVWEYTIGGYQVIKKWLSYREREILGRGLKLEEVRTVTQIVRRIAAILLLQPRLDANYRAVSAAVYPWPTRDSASGF